MSNYELEKTYKVYEGYCGNHIEVGPSADFPGNVRIRTTGGQDGSEGYFGKLDLDVPHALAALLCEAVRLAVADARQSTAEASA